MKLTKTEHWQNSLSLISYRETNDIFYLFIDKDKIGTIADCRTVYKFKEQFKYVNYNKF